MELLAITKHWIAGQFRGGWLSWRTAIREKRRMRDNRVRRSVIAQHVRHCARGSKSSYAAPAGSSTLSRP